MTETKYLHSVFLRRTSLVAFISCFVVVVVYTALIPAFFPELRTYVLLLVGVIPIIFISGMFITRHRETLTKAMIAAMLFETVLLCLVYAFLVVVIGVLARGS